MSTRKSPARTIEPVTDVIVRPQPIQTLRDHFSFSQLSMYLRCSMQYYFRYVLGLKERPKLDLVRGKAGHSALERNARHKLKHQQDQPLEQILDTFNDDFTKQLNDFEKSDFSPGEKPDQTKDQTVQGLTIWRMRDAAKIEPQAVELEFLIPIPPTEDHHEEVKPVNGRIDIISRRPTARNRRGTLIGTPKMTVIDDKFPGRKPSNALEAVLMSDQLTLYDYVLMQAGKKVDALGHEYFIPPTKTLAARVETTYRATKAMSDEARQSRHARLLYKLRTVARAIRAGIFIPTDDPKDCAWCGYRERCQSSLVKDDYEAMQIRAKTSV